MPNTCQAVGKTTGFQTAITGASNPFVVPFRGRVVAWSIKTGAPSTKPNPNNNNQSDLDFFNKTFGGDAQGQDLGPQADHEADQGRASRSTS